MAKQAKQTTTKAPIKGDLIFAFKDLEGKNYYRHRDETKIPVERMAELQGFMIEMTRNLSNHELNSLLDLIDKSLHAGLKDPKNAAKVGAVTYEIRSRQSGVGHVMLYYNYLAACYIREDEDPKVYNQQAQMEKVEAFKKGASQLDSFFFAMPEYKGLCKALNISTKNWKDVIRHSEELERRTKRVIDLLK